MEWETVIGLEVHVQLATMSKLFCGCSTMFGAPPNTHVCPVCLGLPGALPVPNRGAIRHGTRAALGLGCTVHETSVFARKNYFYPDLPKGYQISQYDRPLATNGRLRCDSPERGTIQVGIERLHLEEDAGKSLHDRIGSATAVDLNRAGIPLAEIVTGPDLRSPEEARSFLTTLRRLLLYLQVSDCSMEQGSLRVDANLSLRRRGEPLGTKTEVKNMNSFANVERALSAERDRQRAILERGGQVVQVTLLFDASSGAVRPMRAKEESHDYRYFPDPDLPPLVLSATWIEDERGTLPELPDARRARFAHVYHLSEYEAGVLTASPEVAAYFEAVARRVEGRAAANWVMGDALAGWNEAGRFEIPPDTLVELICLVEDGTVSRLAAKRVFAELREAGGGSAAETAARLGVIQVRDTGTLAAWVDQVLAAHPAEADRYRGGETKLLGFLVGETMKVSRGTADPKEVRGLLQERLKG